MYLFNVMRNYLNSLTGTSQEFEELLAAKDITAVQGKMSNRFGLIEQARREYLCEEHKVMRREDKIAIKKNKDGTEERRIVPVWRLPVPYQRYINEVSLVFMYGRPVKWAQTSEDTDEAFAKFLEVVDKTHFNSKIRQCKRLAGAETESALLFRTFRNSEGKADVQLRVLAASKGDEIYCRWDQYENLMSVGWGYHLTEAQNKVVYHFDVYTADRIYRCTQDGKVGWNVDEEENLVGKIPIIVFQQEREWSEVQWLIEREEDIASRAADTNDYYSDPTMVVSADVLKSLPEKGEAGKVMITNDVEGVDKAARYLTWDSAPESKKQELEWLQDQILNKSFTPKISLDTLKSVSQLSAKALRTVMMLAEVKADRHKEVHDELLTRTANLFKSVIGNVLDVSLAEQCSRLTISHEWQEPFGDDAAEDLEKIIKAVDAGILSTETAIEMNPLVKNAIAEQERLTEEKESAAALQRDIFSTSEPAQGTSQDGASD